MPGLVVQGLEIGRDLGLVGHALRPVAVVGKEPLQENGPHQLKQLLSPRQVLKLIQRTTHVVVLLVLLVAPRDPVGGVLPHHAQVGRLEGEEGPHGVRVRAGLLDPVVVDPKVLFWKPLLLIL